MKIDALKTAGLLAASAFSLLVAGCMGEYDLNDIDTTVEIKVNDLVVPVNLEAIALDSFIELEENSTIKVVEYNGSRYYAITESGSFGSDPVRIDAVRVSNPEMGSSSVSISTGSATVPAGIELPLPLPESDPTTFNFSTGAVDDKVKDITMVGVSGLELTVDFTVTGADVLADKFSVSDLVLQVPQGLVCTADGSYNPSTGRWEIPSLQMSGGHGTIRMNVTGLDLKDNGNIRFTSSGIVFEGETALLGGNVTFRSDAAATLPAYVGFDLDFAMTPFSVTSVSGRVGYQIEGLDIAPVDLGDIPDFFAGGDCNVVLGNPQLYLLASNPLAQDNINFSTGLTVTASRNSAPDYSYSLDNGEFTLGGSSPVQSFVFAPSDDGLYVPEAFGTPEFVRFSGLSYILGVPQGSEPAGFPDRLSFSLDNPRIPIQDVNGFALGRTIDGVSGQYELVAPLCLGDGAVISYSDDVTGLLGDLDDDLNITGAAIIAKVANGCPVSIELSAIAIDASGNEMTGIDVEGCTVAAASESDIAIELSGDIRNLDGLRFKAVMRAGKDAVPFSPDQTIEFKDLRIRIGGNYVVDFNED